MLLQKIGNLFYKVSILIPQSKKDHKIRENYRLNSFMDLHAIITNKVFNSSNCTYSLSSRQFEWE